ncbi:MAG TPA: tetratricopeptide repeat protein [Gammaproteobacteria bacterium]
MHRRRHALSRQLLACLLGWLLLPPAAQAEHVADALLAHAAQLTAGQLPALERRAAAGDAEARLLLGEAYHLGRAVPRDDSVAQRWFTLAADSGAALAQYWLGRKHDAGEQVSQDYALAAQWYRRAAEQGLAAAQNRLGELYLRGLGVDQDYAAALDWFRRAAEQGHDEGLANLAAMHYHGRGVDRDYHAAFVLFHRAAVAGNDAALLTLGNMALHGLGTERSLVDAYRWYGLATYTSHHDPRAAALAESMLERLGPHLSDSQIDDAFDSARAWAQANQRGVLPSPAN